MKDQSSLHGYSYRRRIRAVEEIVILAIWLTLTLPAITSAQFSKATRECGALDNGYGPFDYTNPTHRRESLPVVEQFHFNEEVFRLERGLTGSTPRGDIDYTLRAFPNHHNALDAMARLHRRHHVEKFPEAQYSLRCYFDRARRMAPRDPVVPLLEGIHLLKTGRLDEAETRLKAAVELAPQSAETHYNLGLLYIQKQEFDAAREHARKAYELGYPLPGLRNKLIRANQWQSDANNK